MVNKRQLAAVDVTNAAATDALNLQENNILFSREDKYSE